jgi:hypothetical protein
MFTVSVDTKAVIEILKPCSPKTVVTYEEIQKKIGRNPQKEGRSSVHSARRILERDGILFAPVKNIGLMRLDDSGVVHAAEGEVHGIRRKASRGFNRISRGVQNYTNLTQGDKVKFNASASILGMLSSALHPSKLKRLEDKVKGESGALPLARTLEAFKD